jgi:hypothetical protein
MTTKKKTKYTRGPFYILYESIAEMVLSESTYDTYEEALVEAKIMADECQMDYIIAQGFSKVQFKTSIVTKRF